MNKVNQQVRVHLRCDALEAREMPAGQILVTENFNQSPPTGLTDQWQQWSNTGIVSYELSQARASTGAGSVLTRANSNVSSRLWWNSPTPVDTSISASVMLDTLVPVQLFTRGQNLDTNAASYYAVSVTRGVNVESMGNQPRLPR